jgi:hypothetical protein
MTAVSAKSPQKGRIQLNIAFAIDTTRLPAVIKPRRVLYFYGTTRGPAAETRQLRRKTAPQKTAEAVEVVLC